MSLSFEEIANAGIPAGAKPPKSPKSSGSMVKVVVILVCLLAVGGGAYWFLSQSEAETEVAPALVQESVVVEVVPEVPAVEESAAVELESIAEPVPEVEQQAEDTVLLDAMLESKSDEVQADVIEVASDTVQITEAIEAEVDADSMSTEEEASVDEIVDATDDVELESMDAAE